MTTINDIVGYGNRSARARMGRPLAWALLALIIVITLLPFVWAIRTALSTNPALLSGEFDFTWGNFKRVIGIASQEEIQESAGRVNTGELNFWTSLRNSVIISTTIAIGQVFFSSMAAYAFARMQFAGRDRIFFIYLSGMMIPPIITLIPNVIFIKNLGLIASLPGIILPFFLMTPFAVFFMRQFFLGVSRSMEEAAMIDGASHFRIFRSITLPMIRPQMITLGVLTYVTAWNEFFWPFVVAPAEESVQPLPVALQVFRTQTPGNSPDWGGLMAGTIITTLPVMVIFAIFGKRIVDSIRFTGIK
ncbi:MAG: carbohydrate ABC transporter permease [Actinomycetota bacterium]